jgi:hypothetical protein
MKSIFKLSIVVFLCLSVVTTVPQVKTSCLIWSSSLKTSDPTLSAPHYYQLKGYYCGPASLEMVFNYYGRDISQYEIADAARTISPPGTTYTDDMRRASHFSDLSSSVGNDEPAHTCTGYTGRGLGYAGFEHSGSYWLNDLKTLINSGYPIIVLTEYTAGSGQGHYRVVVGYDDSTSEIIVHDPWNTSWGGPYGGPNLRLSYSTFQSLWGYSSYWGLFTHPWEVSINAPTTAAQGSAFSVTATVTYPCPSPFNTADYPDSSAQATITLPAGFSLQSGETATKTLGGGSMAAGSSTSVSWQVLTANTQGSYEISVSTEGRVSGSVPAEGSYPAYSYTDRIGGSSTYAIVVPPSVIESGLDWLRGQQNFDGSWSYSGTENVGISSLSALAFLNNGILDSDVGKALDWIVNARQADGSISIVPVSREDNRVYDTSMAILALVAGRSLGYTPSDGTVLDTVINNAVTFLVKSQCVGTPTDGYNYGPDDLNYGGWGYPRYDWADLSNTQWAVLGLAAATTAGISKVPLSVWENAAVFTIRCLNDGKYNPNWYGSSDGGFTYRPGGASYESMTGAGVWSLGLCKSAGVGSVTVDGVQVSLDDAIGDGVNWLQSYASVDQNYGNGNYFYYYSLMSVAKGYVIVGQGAAWYQNMVSQLESIQASDGHWPEVYWEEPDTMATAEAILAIETRTPPPAGVPTELYVILGSYANLYITAPDGKHIGIDPNTGQVVNEIPNATFSTNPKQIASIPDPLTGDYNISIFGTGTGPYNLTVEGEVNGTVTSSISFTGTMFQGLVQVWTAVITRVTGPLTIITTPLTVKHDISILNVTTSTPHEYPGRMVNITAVVKNNGEVAETFNVTAYRDNIPIGTILVADLSISENRTLVFTWDTTGLTPCHTWAIKAEAPLVGDVNQSDNTFTDGTVKIAMLGDVNGDGIINLLDLVKAAMAFGAVPGSPLWDPLADIYPDNHVDIFDLVMIAIRFGQHC